MPKNIVGNIGKLFATFVNLDISMLFCFHNYFSILYRVVWKSLMDLSMFIRIITINKQLSFRYCSLALNHRYVHFCGNPYDE